MSEMVVACEKIARLSSVLQNFPDFANGWENSFRFEDDLIIVTNRRYMAIERHVGHTSTPFQMTADAALIEQCRNETQYSSNLHILVNDTLGVITARTTFGYLHPTNLKHFADGENVLDRWRSRVPTQPAQEGNNGLLLDCEEFSALMDSSPSKHIIFEKYVDVKQPSIVRDVKDGNWFGIFWAKDTRTPHDPATLPGWFK